MRRVVASLCLFLVLSFAAQPAFAANRQVVYGRLGVGLGVGQDFVPTGIDPLPGFSVLASGGLTVGRDSAVELIADGLVSGDVIAPRFDGGLYQAGIHLAGMQVLPRTNGSGFALAGAGLAITAMGDVPRYGGSGIVGIGWVAPRSSGAPIGIAAFYAARVVAAPLGFVHAIHADLFLFFAL